MRPWVRRPIVTIDPSDRKMHLRTCLASAGVSSTTHRVSNPDVTLYLTLVTMCRTPVTVCSTQT